MDELLRVEIAVAEHRARVARVNQEAWMDQPRPHRELRGQIAAVLIALAGRLDPASARRATAGAGSVLLGAGR